MIRQFSFLTLATVLTIATFSGTAAHAGPRADAPRIERRFAVAGFDAVELASADTVRILPGAGFAVSAGGDPRAVSSLAVEVRGGTLRIARTPGEHRDDGATVTVTLPALRAATLSGSGIIEAEEVRGRDFTARLPGSGQLRLARLDVEEARIVLSGSGSIAAGGETRRLGLELSGSGRIDADGLHAAVLGVDLGGSGRVAATASRSARIRASGSGSIRVGGNPSCDVTRSGAARVACGG